MRPAARDWLDGLRRFSAEHRPAPPRRPVPAEAEPAPPGGDFDRGPVARTVQGLVLADHLRSWGEGAILALAARHPDAAIVITTSAPAFDATVDLVSGLPAPIPSRVATVTELAYRHWCLRLPDEEHRLHAVLWNWIKAPLPAARRAEFAAYPIPAEEAYWLLRFGHAAADGEWRQTDLWAWNGVTARLVATDVTERFRSRG